MIMMKGTLMKAFLVVSFMPMGSGTVNAALTTTDPLLLLAVSNGSALVNDKIGNETNKMSEIGLLQNSIGIQFNAIKTWEDKYNSYLKTANGYAEALKAGTTLYTDAMVAIRNIRDIKKAVEENPQGLAANLVMSDIYMETVTEFIKTFRILEYSITGEKSDNGPLVPTPAAPPNITPGCVITTVTIKNDSGKDIAFDGKICFVLYGTLADGSYSGYFREKGICTGGDYTIPAGGSKTYTVVFEDNGQGPREVLGMPFADKSQSGQYKSNNCFYIGGSGFTCENMSPGATFEDGGSYTMSVDSDTKEWTGGDGGDNMLNGKERTMMLWSICDRMDELNKKLRMLCMSLWYYRLEDVWNYATRGLLDRDVGDIANESLRRWKRAYEISMSM